MTSSSNPRPPRRAERARLVGGGLIAAAAPLLASSLACSMNLDSPTLVKTPRVLAIVADRPESRPGEDVRVGVIGYRPDDPSGAGTRYRFRLCASLPRVLEASDIPVPSDLPLRDTCEPLEGEGSSRTIPGDRTTALATLIQSLPRAGAFDASFLTRILETAGIPFQVEVDLLGPDDAVLLTAVKTLAITTREAPLPGPTTPPPPVPFVVGDGEGPLDDVRVAMPDDLFSFRCEPERPVVLPAGTELEIAPMPDAEFVEDFPIFGYDGSIRIGHENEYYSYYATGGAMREETTRAPERETLWTTPEEPGTVRLWVIVRDGHLGARGCSLDVTIDPP